MKKIYKELKGASFEGGSRIGHVGGSDIAAIMGKGFKSPFEWVAEKKSELTEGVKEQEVNLLFAIGHYVEPLIAKEFIRRHSEYTLDKNFEKDRTYERLDNSLFHCTPDRFLNKKKTLLELKYDSVGKYYYNSPEDYLLNEGYLWQCQYQMWFFGIEECWLAWVSNRGKWGEFKMHRSDKYSKIIEEYIPEFWERYVLGDEEPPITDVRDAQICKVEHKPIVASKDILDCIERINFIDMQMNILKVGLGYDDKENGYDTLKDKIKVFMGHNDQLLDEDGNELATYKGDKRRQFKLK